MPKAIVWLMGILIAAMAAQAYNNTAIVAKDCSAFGYLKFCPNCAWYLYGRSMEPFFNSNSTVYFDKLDRNYYVGSVIVFRADDKSGVMESRKIVFHQIVGMQGEKLVTRGFNNPVEDTYKVSKKNIIGKLCYFRGSFRGGAQYGGREKG